MKLLIVLAVTLDARAGHKNGERSCVNKAYGQKKKKKRPAVCPHTVLNLVIFKRTPC